MKRRDFLTKAIPAGVVLPSLINGFSVKAFGASTLLSALTSAQVETDHVFVIIQLNGGNDGLNTFIPFQDDRDTQIRLFSPWINNMRDLFLTKLMC